MSANTMSLMHITSSLSNRENTRGGILSTAGTASPLCCAFCIAPGHISKGLFGFSTAELPDPILSRWLALSVLSAFISDPSEQ